MLRTLKQARFREKTLISAIANGESVQEELEKTRAQISDLLNRVPRGDNSSFCILCLWCILTIMFLVMIYHEFSGLIETIWGPPEHWPEKWYLQEYRSVSAQIWPVGQFITSSIWSAVVVVLLLALLWYTQRRLQRRYARALNIIVAVLETFAVLTLVHAAIHLGMLPLG